MAFVTDLCGEDCVVCLRFLPTCNEQRSELGQCCVGFETPLPHHLPTSLSHPKSPTSLTASVLPFILLSAWCMCGWAVVRCCGCVGTALPTYLPSACHHHPASWSFPPICDFFSLYHLLYLSLSLLFLLLLPAATFSCWGGTGLG